MKGHSSESNAFSVSSNTAAAGIVGEILFSVAKSVRLFRAVDLWEMKPDCIGEINSSIFKASLVATIFARILLSKFKRDSGR